MGLEKNFVVKKGIEVATDLLFTDTPTNRVGVGTTVPSRKLDINGDFQAVGDARVVGISTLDGRLDVGVGGTALRVDTGTKRVGINTTVIGYNLDVNGDAGISSNLNVGGITTSSIIHVIGVTSTNYLNVLGVGTIVQINATNENISGISTINLLNVTGVSTFNSDVGIQTTLSFIDNAKAKFGTGGDLEIYHDGLNSYIEDTGTGDLILKGPVVKVAGILSTGTVSSTTITAGIITDVGAMTVTGDLFANSFRGDGSNLTGLDTSGNFSGKTVIAENLYIPNTSGIATVGTIIINNPEGTISATDIIVTNVSASSSVTAANVSVSSSVTANSVSVSSDITAANVSVSSSVTAANVSVSSSVTAANFYGDGANLTNTGAALSAVSGLERIVTTNLTSGTMITAATDGDLTFDASTNTLSCTNFAGDGANLTNTGSTLSATSGTERVVFTNLTSGTMTASSTDANVAFNATTSELLLGTDKIVLNASDGSAQFDGNVSSDLAFQVTRSNGKTVTLGGSDTVALWNSDGNFAINHDGTATFNSSVTASSFSGTLNGADITNGTIPNSKLNKSTISGVSLGSNLATLTKGTYLTGSNYNGSAAQTWAVDATSANTASKVVARDGSGNFSAGTITAELNGTALNATNFNVAADNSTDATHYVTFTGGATGNQRPNSDTGLTWNPSTNTLTAANFSGNATTATNATNAGTLDGYDSATAATGSTVAVRNSSGDITMRYALTTYCNMSHSSSSRTSDTVFYSSTDDYIRKNTASGFRSALNVPTRTGGNASGTWGISISGNSSTATTATNANYINVDESSSNTNYQILFSVNQAAGYQRPYIDTDSGQFVYNPSTQYLTVGNATINSTLNVRGAIDLADNDILRLGSGDDAEFFCNGSHFYLDLNSGIGNFYIRDGSTTRYTFNDNGAFTATGSITSSSGTMGTNATGSKVIQSGGSASGGASGDIRYIY